MQTDIEEFDPAEASHVHQYPTQSASIIGRINNSQSNSNDLEESKHLNPMAHDSYSPSKQGHSLHNRIVDILMKDLHCSHYEIESVYCLVV